MNIRDVCTVVPEEAVELLHPIDSRDFESLTKTFAGSKIRDTWSAPKMRLIQHDERGALRSSDAPWLLASILAFKNKATQHMRRFLEQYGELLPIECGGKHIGSIM